MTSSIDIESLKEFVKSKLRSYPITREFILEEPSYMPVQDFLNKIRIWLRLLEKEVEIGP